MKIEIIDTGRFYADGGAMFGAIPKSAWKRRYPCTEDNLCVLAIRSLLVTADDGRILLIDTGVNEKHQQALSWYGFFDMKNLYEQLRERGVDPEQVNDIVLTHLHFDHCGHLDFPNATFWVSRQQWDNLLAPHPLEAGSLFKEDLMPLYERGQIHLVEDESFVMENFSLRLFDGHTPGQLVPYISEGEQTSVFAGDVIPLAAHVSPAWISAYDLQPLISYESKLRLLGEAVEEQFRIIYCHDAYLAASMVKRTGDSFKAISGRSI
ncbi:MAG: MBL fold metallo-hydrolase [Tannerellaceae bacterium]|nr:MBL fold metallo-hydrolase [Tannerellaceae bacterium]